MGDPVTVFGPATLANVGPGFDVFGLALAGLGDRVRAWRQEAPGVELRGLTGEEGELVRSPGPNTAVIAATAALACLEARQGRSLGGLGLELTKGTPLSSGLGSSAASATAAARAVSELFPGELSPEDLLAACLEAEATVSGRHLDNVAPSLLGGFVLVGGLDPIAVHSLPVPFELDLVVVKPGFGLPTREARAALPREVPLEDAVANLARATTMVHALHDGDRELFVASLVDRLAEPARAPLILGFDEVRRAAMAAGAEAVGISGAGPSLFAVVPDPTIGEAVSEAMQAAWSGRGQRAQGWVTHLDREGARRVE